MPSPQASPAQNPARRWLVGAAGLAGVAVLAGFGRLMMFYAMERDAFVPGPAGTLKPDDLGVTSRQFAFASGDRLLRGSFVAAEDPAAPALSVFHGDEESLADWAPVQALLHAAGISSFVFDYSGYGASTGRPTVHHLHQDALAAYTQFRAATPNAARHYVMAYSLGSGVLLDVVNDLLPVPDGMVIGAGFRSARSAAVLTGKVPRWMAWMLPDPWNNIRRIRKLTLPILLLHSRQDETIPFHDAECMARAAHGPRRLEVFEDLPHNAAIEAPYMNRFWTPVIAYLKSGKL